MNIRLAVVVASVAALVSFLVLARAVATGGDALRTTLATAGFVVFLGLAIAAWNQART